MESLRSRVGVDPRAPGPNPVSAQAANALIVGYIQREEMLWMPPCPRARKLGR